MDSAMKQNHGFIWSEEHKDKTITIGFTNDAINTKLQETFHVLPADLKEVREKGPLLVLETNDGLLSIKAPFAGRLSYFNPKARNFPDRITETDTIVTILPKGVEPPKKEEVKTVYPTGFVQVNMNPAQAAPQPQLRTDMFTRTGPQQPVPARDAREIARNLDAAIARERARNRLREQRAQQQEDGEEL